MHDPPEAGRTYWVDVEDIFLYFTNNSRPSGIQRLVFETLRVLPARARLRGAPRIAFVRHDGNGGLPWEVAFEDIARLFEPAAQSGAAQSGAAQSGAAQPGRAVDPPPGRPAMLPRPTRQGFRRSPVRRLRLWLIGRIDRLPPPIRAALLDAGMLQLRALRSGRMLFARTSSPPPATAPPPPLLPAGEFRGAPGDLLLALGAPWVHRDYAALLRRLRDEHGIEAALLAYDLIPFRRPEWCAAVLVRDFTAWLTATLPLYTRLMAISQATARDLEAYAADIGLPLAAPVQSVPIGTGFGVKVGADTQPARGPLAPGLPAPGSYALFVSTLEARKNHALLFRVWRRLLAELPPAQVPTLVFAGRVGWLVADLMQQLDNADWLDGKIRLLRDPTDPELAALYRGCRFTLFPSLFEGWGLPVSESLEHGRPCIASRVTSLPEVGGDLVRYFDPENFAEVYQTIREVIEQPLALEAWQARVIAEFRHVSWDRTADAILQACATPTAIAETQ